MYKFKSYFLALAVASTALLSSCGKDEVKPSPTLVLTGANASGGTIAAGATYDIVITATSNGGSNLDKYEVLYSQNGGQENVLVAETVTGINAGNYNDTFNGTAAQAGTEKFTFRVTNKDGLTTTKSVTFTIASTNPITYTAKILGASQNATTGSFFSTQTGDVYSSSQASSNSQKVDMVYYYQTGGTIASQAATLAAPANTDAQVVYPGIAAWATKNNTQFKQGTAANFDITTNQGLKTAYDAASGASSRASNLQANSVYLFKTEGDKYGVLKVTEVSTGSNAAAGFIKIDVKVQP